MDGLLLLVEVAEGLGQLIDALLGFRAMPPAGGAPSDQQPVGDTGPMISQVLCSCMCLLHGAMRDVLGLWADLPAHFPEGSSVRRDGDDAGRSPQLLLQGHMLEISRALLSAGRASQKAAFQVPALAQYPCWELSKAFILLVLKDGAPDAGECPSDLLDLYIDTGFMNWFALCIQVAFAYVREGCSLLVQLIGGKGAMLLFNCHPDGCLQCLWRGVLIKRMGRIHARLHCISPHFLHSLSCHRSRHYV